MKFYFETHDGVAYPDDEGTELASLEQARVEAVKVLADFLSERPEEFWRTDELALTVQDNRRATLFTLRLSVSAPAEADQR